MNDVEFRDFSIAVMNVLNDKIDIALEEVAGELEAQAKRNSRVDTGQTKRSFDHYVDTGEHTAYIGSSYQNAIWEEFGTGEFAINGGGRPGKWRYQDARGNWHTTTGKKPSRAFWNAYNQKKMAMIKRIRQRIREL